VPVRVLLSSKLSLEIDSKLDLKIVEDILKYQKKYD